MTEKTEAQLIAAALSTGDRQAFGALVRMHQSALRRVARKWNGGDEIWADDLAQEAFVRAYRGIRKFRAESMFFTWLCRIAYNVYVEQRRKHRSETELAEEVSTSPARDLALHHDLDRAMRKLSEAERIAVTLCCQSEFTHEETAGLMGIPLGTLKSHIFRAKAKLAEALSAWKKED